MLDEREAKILIMDRIKIASESCNSYQIKSIEDQIRGMIWIITGKDPGNLLTTEAICNVLNIPCKVINGMTHWGTAVDPEW